MGHAIYTTCSEVDGCWYMAGGSDFLIANDLEGVDPGGLDPPPQLQTKAQTTPTINAPDTATVSITNPTQDHNYNLQLAHF